MEAEPSPAFPLTSTASQATAFLYVLPCHGEDLLKLGHSRNPLARMQSLHTRFYEFFDTEHAFAVETETVREARALETRLARQLREHRAPAPLTVNAGAGGHTEWYRGAYATLEDAAGELHDHGHVLHRPLHDWLRQRLSAHAELLFSWTGLLTPLQLQQRGTAARASLAQRRVADVLDAYVALQLDLTRWLPQPVLDWHRAASLR